MHIVYYISLFITRCIDLIYLRTKVIGKENIPAKSGAILACNHRSYLDPLVMGATTLRYLNFMAKEELFKPGFTSWFYRQVGVFPIKRDSSDFRAIREAIRRLKAGRLLVLYPEGTRGSGERAKKVNPGVGLLVKSSKVPVLPVYLQGTEKALPEGAKWLKRHNVTVIIGKPLYFREDETNYDIANSIMDEIQNLKPSS